MSRPRLTAEVRRGLSHIESAVDALIADMQTEGRTAEADELIKAWNWIDYRTRKASKKGRIR